MTTQEKFAAELKAKLLTAIIIGRLLRNSK